MRLRRPLVASCFALTSAAFLPGDVRACQNPPSVTCDLFPDATVVQQGDSFVVHLAITNLDPSGTVTPIILDDLGFHVEVIAYTGTGGGPAGTDCWFDRREQHQVDPQSADFVLDDAFSGLADGPTSWLGTFRITPLSPVPAIFVTITACSDDRDGDGACDRQCTKSLCVATTPSFQDVSSPTASFEEPLQPTDGGGEVPFRLRVRRNGYLPGVPLTVRVQPMNFSDALDLFPLSPPGLATAGVTVTGDDEIVSFRCTAHFPCFAGVQNAYAVTIWDGATRVWDSSWFSLDGIGGVRVTRAPMARLELVGVDEAGDGTLAACEDGNVHIRLTARNPYLNATLDGVRLTLDVPPGFALASDAEHLHDNPMDAYDPTPAELAATGVVALAGTTLSVDVTRIESRAALTPPVFRDLHETEIVLDAPAGGVPDAVPLAFTALRVTSTALGLPKSDVTLPLEVPVAPGGAPPLEVSPRGSAQPLRVLADHQTLTWEDASVSGARFFDVLRGDIASLRLGAPPLGGAPLGACVMRGLTASAWTDATPPAPGGTFYLVEGVTCGATGSLGTDSRGVARTPEIACR